MLCVLNVGLCPAGCSVYEPTMEVFGQPAAAANQTVTSSPMNVVTGQQYTAGPAASHPHGVQIPHTDVRWAISIKTRNDELIKALESY